jgi:putative ABC transport system permease protein
VKVHVGSTLNIIAVDGRATTVTIVGIIDRGEQIFPTPLLLMAFNSYQTLPHTGKPSITSNLIYADVPGHSDTNANTVKTRLLGALPLVSITTARDALRNNQSVVTNLRLFLQTAGLLALLIGGLGISNTMEVLLRRRTIEIAMLKTVGYKRQDLYMLFGLEAGVIGPVGGIIGTAVGVAISFGVQALVENAFGIALPMDMNPLTVSRFPKPTLALSFRSGANVS